MCPWIEWWFQRCAGRHRASWDFLKQIMIICNYDKTHVHGIWLNLWLTPDWPRPLPCHGSLGLSQLNRPQCKQQLAQGRSGTSDQLNSLQWFVASPLTTGLPWGISVSSAPLVSLRNPSQLWAAFVLDGCQAIGTQFSHFHLICSDPLVHPDPPLISPAEWKKAYPQTPCCTIKQK